MKMFHFGNPRENVFLQQNYGKNQKEKNKNKKSIKIKPWTGKHIYKYIVNRYGNQVT